jgi:predicted nucleic acid-binding protein
MSWVLDASLTLCWVLPDESTASARAFLTHLPPGEELWVPALWWYEVANGLAAARRRGRITETECAQMLGSFQCLPLQTDRDQGADFLLRLAALAGEHGLSAYDAAYLELARRRGAGLATLDRRLGAAASAAGIMTPR